MEGKETLIGIKDIRENDFVKALYYKTLYEKEKRKNIELIVKAKDSINKINFLNNNIDSFKGQIKHHNKTINMIKYFADKEDLKGIETLLIKH